MPVRRERFADTDLRPFDGLPRLAIVGDLLRYLGVEDAPVEEQRAAVAAWLAVNEPTPLLAASLRAHGLLAPGVLSLAREIFRFAVRFLPGASRFPGRRSAPARPSRAPRIASRRSFLPTGRAALALSRRHTAAATRQENERGN
jgi:hypothetical protein